MFIFISPGWICKMKMERGQLDLLGLNIYIWLWNVPRLRPNFVMFGLHLLILISTYWCPLPGWPLTDSSMIWRLTHGSWYPGLQCVCSGHDPKHQITEPNMRSCSCVMMSCCREVRPGAKRHGLHHRLLARQLQELQLLRPLPHHPGLHAPHLSHVGAITSAT